MRKGRFATLISCRKEKFENKGRFLISSGSKRASLEPREGGGQCPKLWVGGVQES